MTEMDQVWILSCGLGFQADGFLGTIEVGEMVEIIETLCKMEDAEDEASYQDIELLMIFCGRIV